jgi:L-asparaginase II
VGYQPVLEVTRGKVVESVHFGAVAVADASGRLVACWGDPETVTFLRSSAKPFQALPLLEGGAAERFGIPDRELAVACASHSGTDAHVETVASLQARVGVAETDLRCAVSRS